MPNEGITINGKDGTADWTMTGGAGGSGGSAGSAQSYACVISAFDITDNTEMLTADVFCIEGTADQEPGREQLTGNIFGILKKGFVENGPLMPTPQNVNLANTFSSGCIITCSANFAQATARRQVNANAVMSARWLSKGAFATVWNRGA